MNNRMKTAWASVAMIGASDPAPHPMLGLLDKFTAPDVPAIGPNEKLQALKPIKQPATMPSWPGNGLAEHPFVYGGEGYNTISLVKDGKVAWTYQTGGGWEIDDCWMLSNGNVLYTRMQYAEEVTPDKKVVWVIQDWEHLGLGSWIQLLDEPGIPENGEVLR